MKRFLFLALTALAVLVNVQAKEWVLDDQHASFTAQDGDVIIGEYAMGEFYSISIADNAKVTFQGARIGFRDVNTTSVAPNVIPVNCLGNAEITISGEVHITTGREFPAIFIPQGKTLKIYGTDADSLYVHSGPKAAAIGAYNDVDAGSIQIYGGRIEAQGGRYAAAIGGAYLANCGGIDIYGGQIKATGGENAAAIGSGFDSSHAGYVNISGNVKVHAQGSFRSAGIGCGWLGTCGVINISGSNTNVTAIKGDESQCSIGLPKWFTTQSCGTITIGGKTYPDGVVRSYFNYPNIHDIDLSTMRNDFTVEDGDVLFGTLGADRIRITVADNAKITLRNAVIPELLGKGSACGLECLGDAEITLEGNNEVWHRGGGYYPAIFYPENHTLNIKGNGKLVAHGGGSSAAIGTGACLVWKESIGGINVSDEDIITCLNKWAGNLNIYSGTIEAYGGVDGPGIGAARHAHCGEIQILGGKVTAYGGQNAPGIGAAGWTGAENPTVCGDIRISGGTVYARGKGYAPAIGAENFYRLANCGNIWIMNTINKLTAVKGDDAEKCIWSPQGNVTINGETYPGGINLHAYYYPEEKVINLANQHFNITVPDGYTLTGTLTDNIKIEIEDGAEVLLQDVVINGNWDANTNYGGLTCLGDAVIRLEGTNAIKSPGARYAAISVPDSKTLAIYGPGSLKAEAYEAAGIGANHSQSCGHIIIFGGTIEASSQKWCAGIGGATGSAGLPLDDGHRVRNGYIYIYDGNVTAIGGENAAGIGSGYDDCTSANIFILGGVVKAVGNDKGAAIGAGGLGSASDVYLYSGIKSLKAYKGDRAPQSIGKGYGMSSFGRVLIDEKFYSNGIDINPYFYPNGNVINLGDITNDFTIENTTILTGKLTNRVKISVKEGVTLILQDAEINLPADESSQWAGLECLGTVSIVLKGTNTVASMDVWNPAIYIPQNKTLNISGTGTLYAHAHGWGASIGAGYNRACGNITINGGTIEARTDAGPVQAYGAGIGGSWEAPCGNITINGGLIYAYGNEGSAGIGTSKEGISSANKKITLNGGTIYAYGGSEAPAIGAGWGSQIGDIILTTNIEYIRAEAGENAVYSIGKAMSHPDKVTKCGKVYLGNTAYDGVTDEVFYWPMIDARDREATTIDLSQIGNGAAGAPAKAKKATGTSLTKLRLVNGDVVTGTASVPVALIVPDNAKITLNGVTLVGENDYYKRIPAVYCEGSADITLYGSNILKGHHSDQPAIFIQEGRTLKIGGNGSLNAKSWGAAPAIGGKYETNCGKILLTGGTYVVEGGTYCPAIGSIQGQSCDGVEVSDGVTLTATKGTGAPNTIGAGKNGTCGAVIMGGSVGAVTDSPYQFPYTPTWSPTYVDLSQLTTQSSGLEIEVHDGAVITGTLAPNVKVKIWTHDGVIKLKDVTITGANDPNCDWAGITVPAGGTTVYVLEGTNTIRGFYKTRPAIEVPSGARLRLRGTGSLIATTNGESAAIGGDYNGQIEIAGGTVTATGGKNCPAIGSNYGTVGEGIYLKGGTIIATGGAGAPAIGAGYNGYIWGVKIEDGVTKVVATKGAANAGQRSKYSIGADKVENKMNKEGTVSIAKGLIRGIKDDVFTYEPAVSNIMNYAIQNGETLEGDYSRFHLTVERGADFNLKGVTINGANDKNRKYAGITCNGSHIVTMVNGYENTIKGFFEDYPAIQVDGLLIIKSDGRADNKLIVSSNGKAPAIGSARNGSFEYLAIQGGTIEAIGGDSCPAIGTGINGACTGYISLDGSNEIKPTVIAQGGKYAPAIGAGVGGTCASVNVTAKTEYLKATAGEGSQYSISPATNNQVFIGGVQYKDGIELSPFYYPSTAGLPVRRLQNLESLEGEVPYRIRIAPDAIVSFSDVTIGGQDEFDYNEPGIICEGNAGIILMGHSTVQSFNPNYPGIYVPEGCTLVLYALVGSTDAALDASSKGDVVRLNTVKKVNGRYVAAEGSNPKMAAGIGGYVDAITGSAKNCGNILINGANITATGGAGHPGIGGGTFGNCGTITINGGSVLAIGGPGAPGIGAGTSGNCGAIRLTNQVTRVEARAGEGAPNSVGFAETDATIGMESSCESIIVGHDSYGEGITDPIFIYEPTDEERKEDIEIVNGNAQTNDGKIYKVMINGQLLIINGNQIFTITGQRVK